MVGSKGSYALVTGASSGIGYELAKLFAKDGKDVVVIARSKDKLEELKRDLEKAYGVKVRVLVKDLSDPKAPQEVFSELEREGIDVDVLVNNAGFPVYGEFAETDLQAELSMIQVNITALTHFTKLFLRKMVQNKSGWVLNVGSVGSLLPTPFQAVYCASKAYVLSYSEAIANELRGTGVRVTCLCPGPTQTRFYERNNEGASKVARMKMLDAARVASAGYTALRKGRTMVVPGPMMSLTVLAPRIVRRNWVPRVMRAFSEPS